MGRQNKIEKWGLEKEVQRLREDGKSYKQIADSIAGKYAEVKELKNISAMSIQRYFENANKQHMRDIIEKEDNPSEVIEREFNDKMRNLMSETETLKEQTDELMNKAMKDDASINDLTKIIKVQNRNLDQIRKNLVSLREFTDDRFRKPSQQIHIEKQVNVKNLMLDISNELCPKCRKKVHKLLFNAYDDEYDEEGRKKVN